MLDSYTRRAWVGQAGRAGALTTGGMALTDSRHAPACATTLIVGLGILSAPRQGALIVLAVGILVTELLARLGPSRRLRESRSSAGSARSR